MIAPIQNVPIAPAPAVGNAFPAAARTAPAGDPEALFTPSVIVSLGATLRPPLTYNEAGLIEVRSPLGGRDLPDTATSATVLSAAALATTAFAAPADTSADVLATPPVSVADLLLPDAAAAVAADPGIPFIPGAPGTEDVDVPAVPVAAPPVDPNIVIPPALPGADVPLPPLVVIPPEIELPPGFDLPDPANADPVRALPGTGANVLPPPVVVTPPGFELPPDLEAPGPEEVDPVAALVALTEPPRAAPVPAAQFAAGIAATAPVADPAAVAASVSPSSDAGLAPEASLTQGLAAPRVPAPAGTPVTPDAAAAAAPITPSLVDAAALAHRNISSNPFYPGLAATMYVNAMIFRLQQSSAAELPQSSDAAQPVSGIRAVTPVSFGRNGPADEELHGYRMEWRAIASAITRGGPPRELGAS